MKYTDITSHEIACKVLVKDPALSTTVDQQLDDWANAINKVDKFTADYKNPKQQKWFPIFDAEDGGFALSRAYFDDWDTNALCGSRLCERFRNEKIALFYGEQAIELHKKRWFGSVQS